MDISSVSAMSSAQLAQSIDIAVTKKAMNQQATEVLALLDSLQQAIPSFGHTLDTYV